MSQTPITVEYELKELLDKLDKKMDKLDEKMDKIDDKVDKLEIGQAALIKEVEAIKKDVTDIKGSQRNQIWSLIGIIATAVLSGIVIAVWRTAIASKI